ncbi:MAG: replicative DNA helicase [Ferruginibacter sp.]|nr:replicative DNA helicase [Ferruginibacter sp.]
MDLSNINKQQRTLRMKPQPDVTGMAFGKVPPQARDLEEAVLGAIMLEKGAFDAASEILKPECFYVEAHQRVFRAMQSLALKSMPIDLLTVVEELKFNGDLDMVGGAYYLTKLTNTVVSSANIETHSRIILQKFIQRELIRVSSETIRDAFEDTIDVFTMLDDAESRLFEITNNHLKKNFDNINEVLVDTIKRIEDMRNREEDITGVYTGFPTLDHVTYGWQPTDLIILAARPSVGKTAFALNLARSAAMHPVRKTPVGFFSLEMSSSQLVQRILSAESEIPLEKITRGKLEDYEMEQLIARGVTKLNQAQIFIDDTAALNIFELRSKARRLKNKYNVGLIIIDYLQLMSGAGDNRNANREQEISRISRDLKGLAKELQIPVIALSQLSREVEKRKEGSKIPQLSDLRESGAIEQDADMVMFLYRPEYHEINQNEHGESLKGHTQIRIAKHRNGSLENIDLMAKLEFQKFVEMDRDKRPGLPSQSSGHTGNFKPIFKEDTFISKSSRMNDGNFDQEDSDPDF